MAPARKPPRRTGAPTVRTAVSSDDAHDIVFLKRHRLDDADETVPGRVFLNACPPGVRAKFRAVLVAVAAAPPKRFAGGGYWEAMKGDMSGWFEVRVDGPNRHHYRLFCQLDYEAKNRPKPFLVVIAGWTSLSEPSSAQPTTPRSEPRRRVGEAPSDSPTFNGQPCADCQSRDDAVECIGPDGYRFETGRIEAERAGLTCTPVTAPTAAPTPEAVDGPTPVLDGPTFDGQPCAECEGPEDAVVCPGPGFTFQTGRIEAARLGLDCMPAATTGA